jgi:hypothetical protein
MYLRRVGIESRTVATWRRQRRFLCRWDTAEIAHNIDHDIMNVLGNPIKNDIVSDVVCVYVRLDKLINLRVPVVINYSKSLWIHHILVVRLP